MPPKGNKGKKPYGFFESSGGGTRSTLLKSSADGLRLKPSVSVLRPRVYTQTLPDTSSASQPTHSPDDQASYFDGEFDGSSSTFQYDDGILGVDDSGDVVQVTEADVALGRAKRYQNSDFPLLSWIPLRDEYLDEHPLL
ncbi:hypothetical protein FA95DRAFT_1614214 [Auriscalpium vulgare]|uniref:Uncharacterized protein n=1 Tax=Auriscalpium vulgare TaxID=40419 RepID=A0ACB8QZY2_9AGAM|nr:hypothetical protein FA95DRAFT_1614214 [Auriscalpium vulgare]